MYFMGRTTGGIKLDDFLKRIADYVKGTFASSGVVVSHPNPIFREDMVKMRDGKRLETYYYLPQEKGVFPTILMRSCYPMADAMYRVNGEEWAKRGYAYVCQYCRGTSKSEGDWVPNENERNDGLDTVTWLCGQDWVGDIGYTGSSYLALTGWAMADALPNQVKSLYLTQYGADRYTSAYQGGLFRHDVLTSWAIGNAGFKVEADYMESCRYRPHVEVDEALWGRRLDWYRSWVTSTRREDPYWQQGFWKLLSGIPAKVNIPVYIGEGWYDHHLGSALVTYESLSPKSRESSFLNIGCWNHSFQPCMEGRETHNLQNDDMLNMIQWFEETLKNGRIPKGKIRTYQINKDCWREWPSWPIPVKKEEIMYLEADHGLSNEIPDGGNPVSFIYDPEDPVPSHGAESMLHSMGEAVGSLRQPEPGWRKDVVSFVSRPLERDIEIGGKIRVQLYVASDAADTSFTAKVMEVFPGGAAYNIRSSITTLAFREGGPEYTPGDIVPILIEMWDIDWFVAKGNRIRVDISSSDFPQYAVHSNYPGIWSEQKETKKAVQTIYTGGQYASKIIFPIAGLD